MPSPDVDVIKGMAQALEHTLTTLDKASATATQLISAQTSGKPLSAATLEHYRREFENLTQHRERMRELIGKWWTLVEGERPRTENGGISVFDKPTLSVGKQGWRGQAAHLQAASWSARELNARSRACPW